MTQYPNNLKSYEFSKETAQKTNFSSDLGIKISDLLSYNKRGLIPGPYENEDSFLKRISSLSSFNKEPQSRPIFDSAVDWVPITYQNKGLSFWEGAATWIAEDGSTQIQLRKSFQKGSFLGIYRKDEIIDHELAHAARSAFQEPKFEEFLAYQTSPQAWRRIFGPLFRHTWEPALFLGASILPLVFPSHLLLLLPLSLTLFGLARLAQMHLLWKRCLKNLQPFVKQSQFLLPFLFRLTDKEILLFSRSSHVEIKSYIEKETSLRWQVISQAYLTL